MKIAYLIENAIKRAYWQRFDKLKYYNTYQEFAGIATELIDVMDENITKYVDIRLYLGKLFDRGYSATMAADKIVDDFN